MLGQVTFVINGIMGIFGTAVNCLVAFIVAIYVLLSKDTFKRQTKKLVSAFLPERHIQVLSSILKESDKIFGGFISGKIIDSLIIGAICFVCCLILRFESRFMEVLTRQLWQRRTIKYYYLNSYEEDSKENLPFLIFKLRLNMIQFNYSAL